MTADTRTESTIKSRARQAGYRVVKHGKFALADTQTNCVVMSNASLEQIAEFLDKAKASQTPKA
jgi:hypothetical protein